MRLHRTMRHLSSRTHAGRASPLQTPLMTIFRTVPVAFAVSSIALLVAGCGSQTPHAADTTTASASASAPASDATASTTPTRGPRPAQRHKEPITSAGIAAVVEDHLGAGNIKLFGSYGDEPGSVDLIVGLRSGGRRDMFLVSAYSPAQGGGEFGNLGKCPRKKAPAREMRQRSCRKLKDGTTVMAYLTLSGFSDDNSHGRVVSGTAQSPDGSVTLAMYESYDSSPPVSVADLSALLSDPRLTWRTDSAVNDAGQRIKVRKFDG